MIQGSLNRHQPVPPRRPVAPVAPVSPRRPVTPVAPVSPAQPRGPVRPVDPVAPGGPPLPGTPVGPQGPAGPDRNRSIFQTDTLVHLFKTTYGALQCGLTWWVS